jgi:5-methylcytosine-specific restriction enzyme subunit McrC
MALGGRRAADRRPRQTPVTLHLTEYTPASLPRAAIAPALGERLWRRYGQQITVEFPTPKTGDQWRLTPLGWVGVAPVTPALTLELAPRIPVRNLFGMLAYAWDLQSFHVLDGLAASATVAELYEGLAEMLARRVLAQAQRGLCGAYVPHAEERAAVRGRLDMAARSRRPWPARLPCAFTDYTPDCLENRALRWTLHLILRSRLCSPRTLPVARQAYRALSRAVALTPCAADDLAALTYHPLNEDYRALHALCRFFLSQVGPGMPGRDAPMIPFLVLMARLFERFVAAWLAAHLPAGIALRPQERIPLHDGALAFVADGVWRDRATGAALGVFDTKYTVDPRLVADDIAQVVAYAQALGCRDALLIYPAALAESVDLTVGDIRVRAAAFPLAGDLEAAGRALLATLLAG